VLGARRLLRPLRSYRGAFAASLVLGACASVFDGFTFSLLIPFLRLLFRAGPALAHTPSALERVLASIAGPWLDRADAPAALAAVMTLIAASILLKNACLYGAGYWGVKVQEGVIRDLRVSLYAHVQRLGLPFFGAMKGGQLAARVLSDTEQTRGAVQGLAQGLRSAALVAVYLAILFALSWRLALVALALVPALALGMRPVLRTVRRRAAEALEQRGELAAVAVETAANARLVKAHAGEAQERARFTNAAGATMGGTLRAQRVALLASPLSETLGAGVLVLLLVVSGPGGGGGLRPELFVTFVAVTLRLLSPMKALAQFPALMAEALAAADRVFEVLDRPPEDADPPGALTFRGVRDVLEFRDVWVAYEPGQWALRGITLRVAPGEVVAIVGPSGAGKSTLVDLLPRFVEPTRGVVLADGVPLGRFSRRSLRAALGIVGQDTVLFNDTVRANIAYGDRADATDAEIEAAAGAANAHEFILRLPGGYATMLGERGERLSGGERQRLAIARALLRDPPMLILDEATAALDAEAEREVQEAVARLMAGRTVLMIAHRLATIRRADRIVVLEDGSVVESGSHDALVAAGGLYGRLHELQSL
jgi:ATP-binding cassette, subfamily B, bacterial MsbA